MESDPVRLVEALAHDRPAYLSGLESIVGDVDMSFRNADRENRGFLWRPAEHGRGSLSPLVEQLSITYAWDMYHEDAQRPRDVRLLEYTLWIRCERALVERILERRFGAPRPVVDEGEVGGNRVSLRYAGFHPFYVGETAAATLLSWYATLPRFAMPVPDPQVRRAWIVELRRRLETAMTVDELDAFCREAPSAAGIAIRGTLNRTLNRYAEFTSPTGDGRDYWIRFVPPIRANLLIDVFDWGPAVGVSHDVHMSSWHIERRGDKWLPLGGAGRHWQIEAALDRRPTGAAEPDQRGSRPAYGIGAGDEVTAFAVQPRFR